MEEHDCQHILSLNIEARPAKAGEERYKTDELHLQMTSFYIYISFYPSVHQLEVSSSNTGLVLVKCFSPAIRQFCFFSPAPLPVWGCGWGQTLGLCQARGAGFDCHGCCLNKAELNRLEINPADATAVLAFICEKTDLFACSRWQQSGQPRAPLHPPIHTHTHTLISALHNIYDNILLTNINLPWPFFLNGAARLQQRDVNYNIPKIKG